MMERDTYEGVWEEILGHGEEFAGRRVRVTVLPATPQSGGPPSLKERLRKKIGQVRFEPNDVSERVEELFGDSMQARHEADER